MGLRTLSIWCCLLGLLAGAPAASAATAPPAQPTPPAGFLPNRVIVEWAPGASRSGKAEARAEADVTSQMNLGDHAFQLVEVESGQTPAAAIAELESHPAVVGAERDSYSAPSLIPDDPLFGQLWGLENLGTGINGVAGAVAGDDIDAPGAWDLTVGTPTTVVADIDSGYRFDSPELGPVAWENAGEIPANGEDDDGNGYVDDVRGYDFVGPSADSPTEDNDPSDDNIISGGHGLHTAGTIGAAGDNGVGITGVAQDVRIMPLRVCANSAANHDEARCPTSSIIAAINYAGANGARVANISLSGSVASEAALDAFASNSQTLYVVAAGNDGQDNDSTPHYPCAYQPTSAGIDSAVDNIVCVAATNQADGLAGFSNWGATSVDLGAPGTEILSTYPAIEELLGEDFEANDFATEWSATGPNGGFGRIAEPPLTSFGITDSPGAAPAPDTVRESILTTGVAVPSGYGACQLSGKRFVALGGGTFTQTVYKDGVSAFNSNPASTVGATMAPFSTVPIKGLAGTTVKIRFRYAAGPSPAAGDGVWLDDLKLACYQPVSAPLTYSFLQGTSMAAPHATGTAALLFSLRPEATVTAVRNALLASVDPVPSLTGKSVTGGRLDAAKALGIFADETAPDPPALTATDPASPANENQPRILGAAEAGSQVQIYAGAACAGLPLAGGSAAELASPGIAVSVADNSVNEFSATATDAALNVSACSAPISYAEVTPQPPDKPAPPVLTGTSPLSPAADALPRVLGSAAADAEVALFLGVTCEGPPIAEGTAAELESPGIAVSVPAGVTRQFSATATDAAESVSTCSNSVSYTNSQTVVVIGPVEESSATLLEPLAPITAPPATPAPPAVHSCKVPKLAGRTLAKAKAALAAAGCRLGKVSRPRSRPGQAPPALVVKSSTPAAGKRTSGGVALKLGPRPSRHRH